MKDTLRKIVQLALALSVFFVAVAGILLVLDVLSGVEARELLTKSLQIVGITSVALAAIWFILRK